MSWEDAQAYCKWLAERSGLSVRLPSEAEWENACRAGSRTEYAFGDDPARLGQYAWFDENSDGRAHAVKTKRPNAWGLYDLHGNVWEWCEDTWHKDYKGAPEDARAWTEGGEVWEPAPRRTGSSAAGAGAGRPSSAVPPTAAGAPRLPLGRPRLPPRLRAIGPLIHRAIGAAPARRAKPPPGPYALGKKVWRRRGAG